MRHALRSLLGISTRKSASYAVAPRRASQTPGVETLEDRCLMTTYWSPATGAHQVYGDIEKKYLSVGGTRSFLGYPLTDELGTPNGRGRYNHFQGGSIYWSPGTGAHLIYGAIRDRWASMGWENSLLGFPTTDELGTPDGKGRFNLFEGGSVYWTSQTGAFEVHGAIRDKWASLGFERSFLGYPLTNETVAPDGRGRYNHFQGGSVYWSPTTGAREVHGAIRDLWASLKWERGVLGYPVTDEMATPDGKGRFQIFQGGSAYWTPQTGAREVHGAIRDKWASFGLERGFLGYPLTNEMVTPDGRGRYNHFQGGSIYWTPQTGAREVHGPIRDLWASLSWERGYLGYPLTDELVAPDGKGRFQVFQGGSVYWTPQTGAREVHGAIRDKWGSLGWEKGFLGYPLTNETVTPDGVGRYNHFQGGSIYWSPQTGAREVHGAIRDKWASLGWEKSQLGYPTSDELPFGKDGRVSNFQGGRITWTPYGGAVVETAFNDNSKFAFGNFKFNISFPLVKDAFGEQQTNVTVWNPFGDDLVTPIPTPGALAFTAAAALGLNDKGACFGISLASLRLLHHPEMINSHFGLPAGAAPVTKNLVANGNLINYIERQHLFQLSSQVIAYYKNWQITGHNSAGVRNQLAALLRAGDPPIVSIQKGLGKGHAMVATGITPGKGPNDYYIEVYDSNQTGSKPWIHVNPDNRWTYYMANGEVWSGGFGSLMLLPYGVITESPTLPTTLAGLGGIIFGESMSVVSPMTASPSFVLESPLVLTPLAPQAKPANTDRPAQETATMADLHGAVLSALFSTRRPASENATFGLEGVSALSVKGIDDVFARS